MKRLPFLFKAYFFTALLLVFSFLAAETSAQEILKQYKKPLPEVADIDESTFIGATKFYSEVPFGDEGLGYEIRLDKTWEKFDYSGGSTYNITKRLLGEVVRYYSPPGLGERSRFTIKALELEYNLSAEQWFLQYVLSNGYTPMGMKVHNENKVEAVYLLIEGDTSYIVRSIAHINGKRMILAQYFVPDERWEEEKDMQARVMGTFKLTKIKQEVIEQMLVFQFLDVSELEYPVSWKLHAPPLRSVDRMEIALFNTGKGKSLDGQIEIHMASNFIVDSLAAEIQRHKKSIEEKGFVFGEMIEKKDDYIFDENIQFAAVEVYKVSDKNRRLLDYELWFTVMAAGDYYYFATLLTPARDDDYFVWARNTETYRLVVQSITPLEESLVAE